MLPLLRVLALLTLCTASASAQLFSGAPPPPPSPPTVFPGSYYATFKNGPPTTASFFPIAVWFQFPQLTGHNIAPYANVAAAAKAAGMNIFLLGYPQWPVTFGGDNGELAAAKAAGMYVMGGGDPSGSNTSILSVASVQALLTADNAQATHVGYILGDEPSCTQVLGVQLGIAATHALDPTRPVLWNQADWVPWILSDQYATSCPARQAAALLSTDISSFDNYPVTQPYNNYATLCDAQNAAQSDWIAVSQDCLWAQGMGAAQALTLTGPIRPLWDYVESGGDNFGFSGANNSFSASTDDTTTLTNTSGVSAFTSAWVGLTVNGANIYPNATITGIIDATHATMSHVSTAPGSTTVSLTGGSANAGSGCLLSVNLCLPNGNKYRATPAEVNSEAWASLINGATGILWFCQDTLSNSFCLGDPAAGAAASTTFYNLQYIDGVIASYATLLNTPNIAGCSMQNLDSINSMVTSCTNGIFTMASGNPSVPGMAMLKRASGVTYVFAMSERRGAAVMTYTLAGLASRTATVIYDSDARYDPSNSEVGRSVVLNGSSQFSDALGNNGDNYQVKIYSIH